MTDRKPTWEPYDGDGSENDRDARAVLGPVELLAYDDGSWSVNIEGGDWEDGSRGHDLVTAKRGAIDAARKIVAEWSSELDRLAEECR